MNSTSVQFEPAAYAELLEAQAWYARRSRSAALRFERAVDHARQLIAEGPNRWQRVEHDSRQIRLRGFPYFLVYRPDVRPIAIVAVAHASRERGYWRDRVSDE